MQRNHTAFTYERILGFKLLGQTVRRQRTIALYQHPNRDDLLIAVDENAISCESKQAWSTALAYIARGKVYHN